MQATRCLDYKPVLKECFAADKDLIGKWHVVAGKGLNSCVEKTYSDLQAAHVAFFMVHIQDELVGYFAKEDCGDKEFLTGFFLMPDLRTSVAKSLFWTVVKANFDGTFYCGVYEKNIPAKKFIEARGGKPVIRRAIKDGDVVLYKIGA